MTKNKAFLGAIGDDLPSLIPLVFAILIFMSVFISTWNTYTEKTEKMQIFLYALKLGDVLSSKDYLSTYGDFEKNCQRAQTEKKYRFIAGLVHLPPNPLEKESQHLPTIELSDLIDYQTAIREDRDLDLVNNEVFLYEETKEGKKYYYCTNTKSNPSSDLTIQLYPVALERNIVLENGEKKFYVEPALLVIAIWR